MFNRLTQLSFIIGLFFTIVAIILLVGYFSSALLSSFLNLYAAIVFLIFGLMMIIIKPNNKHKD
jgi:putative Mn2+ efflux pump MntP